MTLLAILDGARTTDPFGCLASGNCPPPDGPLPAGTSGLLFLAVGLVAAAVAFRRVASRPPAAPAAGSSEARRG